MTVLALMLVGRWLNATKFGGQEPTSTDWLRVLAVVVQPRWAHPRRAWSPCPPKSDIVALEVTCTATIPLFSDGRVKRIEGRSDAARDLAALAGIEITDYTYIDTVTKGAGTQKKVIAQQVEQVYPQAVSRSTDVVPDIYQKAQVKDGWVMLATDLRQGERVRLIGKGTEGVHEVLAVADGKFRTDFAGDGDQIFVYGREVKDFRSVDYDAIAMLNVSATQELKRRVETQAAGIAELEKQTAEIAMLKQQLAELRAAFTAARLDAAGVAPARVPQDR